MSNRTLTELYIQYHKLVFAICKKVLLSSVSNAMAEQTAEDLSQIVFEKIRINMHKADLPTPEKERAWVAMIAKHTALNEVRRKFYVNETLSDFEEIKNAPDTISLTVLDEISFSETKEEIISELNKLGNKYKNAIILRYFYGYGNEEIAAELNITYRNARGLLYRGLKKLSASEKLQAIRRDGIV